MKHILSLLLIVGFFGNLYAQYPNTSNKMRLGAQTTGDGLIFRTDSIPDWTPSSLNNAWLAIDTLTGNLYSYQSAEWRLEVAGDLRTVYPKVINKSGTNIKRGQPVMVDYNQVIQGDLIRILPADGSGTYAGVLTMGIASTDIADDEEGYITWFGYVREVKQSDIAETGVTLNIGDILYLSGTQLGKLTNVEPTAPKLRVTMALVVRKPNANNLTLLVRPSLNMDLGELNDVDLTGLNDGETIVWDSAGGKWIAGVATGGVIDTTVIATRAYVDGNVDSTRLVADSILVYYIGGVEVGRDTINIPPAGVTSITAGVGLTGGTITSTGTIAADTSVLATQTYVTTRGYLTTEVDGSVTNEGRLSTTLQVAPNWVDINTNTSGSNPIVVNGSAATGSLVSGTTNTNGGVIALSNDTTVLSTKWFVGSKVDSTRLVQDSILVYYTGGAEVGRDTISGVGGGGGGGGTMSSFTLAGSTGTPQTINDGNTLTIAAGVGISTTAVATDQVTVAADTTTVLASKTFLSTRGYTTGSGTTGTIPIWSSTTALGNSALTEASGSVTAGGTGFFRLPNGTTAQRPGTPAAGMTRYNTSNGALEYYGAAAWEVPVKSATETGLGTAATGGIFYPFYADVNGRATNAILDNNSYSEFQFKNQNENTTSTAAVGLVQGNTTFNALAFTVNSNNSAFVSLRGVKRVIASSNETTGNNEFLFQNWDRGNSAQVQKIRFVMNSSASSSTNIKDYITINEANVTINETNENIDFIVKADNAANLLFADASANRIGVQNNAPARTFHVTGEARITDLTTDTPTRIVGADADGDLGAITIGTGLTLSNDTLSSTGAGTTNLTFSGTSSPITLNSDTGTDVRFIAGSGVTLAAAGDSMTIAATAPTRQLANLYVQGAETVVAQFDIERIDLDNGFTLQTAYETSEFVADSCGITYIGTDTAYVEVTAVGTLVSSANASINFGFIELVNGQFIEATKSSGRLLTSTSLTISTIPAFLQLAPNERLELAVENTTAGTPTITTIKASLTFKKL